MAGTTWHPREGRGVIPLRPLSPAEILDAPFAVMRRYPAPMLGVGAVVSALLTGGSLGWNLWLRTWALDHFSVDAADALGLGLSIAAILLVLVAAGWQTALTADAVLGRDSTAAHVWDAVRPRIWTLILAALVAVVPPGLFIGCLILTALVGVGGGILSVVLFGPALWLGILALFLAPVVVIEGASVRVAVSRVFALIKGSWWRCFWLIVLTSLSGSMVALGVLLPFEAGTVGFLSGGVLTGHSTIVATVLPAIAVTLVYAIMLPVFSSVIAVLYMDVRIRTEAFDLTLTGAVPQRAAAPRA